MLRVPPPRGQRAVLFDLVGTLTTAVSATQRNLSHRRVAAALGTRFEAYLDVLLGSYYERASGRRGTMCETMRWVARHAGSDPTGNQLDRACAIRRAAERALLRPRPGAVRVLAELRRRGVRIAVVSDCTHEVPALWPNFPLRPYVDAAIFSIDVGVCKPDPRMYVAACERLGVQPAECLYIGDGGSRELSGARAVGMTASRLVAPDSDRHAAHLSEHDWAGPVITTLSQVLAQVAPMVRGESARHSPVPVRPEAARPGLVTQRHQTRCAGSPSGWKIPAPRIRSAATSGLPGPGLSSASRKLTATDPATPSQLRGRALARKPDQAVPYPT